MRCWRFVGGVCARASVGGTLCVFFAGAYVSICGRGQSGLCVFGIFARRHNRMCMQVSFVGGSRRNSFKTRSLKNHANNAILAKTPFSIIPGKRTSTH
jgi:hypothetical protein